MKRRMLGYAERILRDYGVTTDVRWYGFRVHPDNQPLAWPGVYLFVNLTNGRQHIGNGLYVGEAHILRRRVHDWSCHNTRGGTLYDALRIHGNEAFLLIPLWYVKFSPEMWFQDTKNLRLRVEGKYIKEFRPEYNLVEEGHAFESEAVRKRSAKGRMKSSKWREAVTGDEAKARGSVFSHKRWQQPGAYERHDETMRRIWSDPERREYQRDVRNSYLADETNYRNVVEQLSTIQKVGSDAAAKVVTGSKWFTNGTQNLRLSPADLIPEGFYEGRSHHWINNGVEEQSVLRMLPIPDGWSAGRIIKKRGKRGEKR